jgi:hypothetical protein
VIIFDAIVVFVAVLLADAWLRSGQIHFFAKPVFRFFPKTRREWLRASCGGVLGGCAVPAVYWFLVFTAPFLVGNWGVALAEAACRVAPGCAAGSLAVYVVLGDDEPKLAKWGVIIAFSDLAVGFLLPNFVRT